jgi:hypothetical protein
MLNQGACKVKFGGNIDIIIVVGQRWNEFNSWNVRKREGMKRMK